VATHPFNIVKGRAIELVTRVKNGDPAAARLYVIPLSTSVAQATAEDVDDFAALITAGAVEQTAGGWSRITIAAADITALTPDDTNNRYDDLVWTPSTCREEHRSHSRPPRVRRPSTLNVIAGANQPVSIFEWGISFDGVTASAVPATVELCQSTQATAGTSAASPPAIVQVGGRPLTAQPTPATTTPPSRPSSQSSSSCSCRNTWGCS
jgi:hypothetical protein